MANYGSFRRNTLTLGRRGFLKTRTAIKMTSAALKSPSRHAVRRKLDSMRGKFSIRERYVIVGRMLFKMGGRYRGDRFYWS